MHPTPNLRHPAFGFEECIVDGVGVRLQISGVPFEEFCRPRSRSCRRVIVDHHRMTCIADIRPDALRANGSFRSSTFTLVSSVPITLESNNSFFIVWYSGASNSAHRGSQPPMVLREISTPCRSNIFS